MRAFFSRVDCLPGKMTMFVPQNKIFCLQCWTFSVSFIVQAEHNIVSPWTIATTTNDDIATTAIAVKKSPFFSFIYFFHYTHLSYLTDKYNKQHIFYVVWLHHQFIHHHYLSLCDVISISSAISQRKRKREWEWEREIE